MVTWTIPLAAPVSLIKASGRSRPAQQRPGVVIACSIFRACQRTLARVGFPHKRFFDLRDTRVMLLLAQGVDLRTLMETLGHSQISLMRNLYAHVIPALQQEAASKMDHMLRTAP